MWFANGCCEEEPGFYGQHAEQAYRTGDVLPRQNQTVRSWRIFKGVERAIAEMMNALRICCISIDSNSYSLPLD